MNLRPLDSIDVINMTFKAIQRMLADDEQLTWHPAATYAQHKEGDFILTKGDVEVMRWHLYAMHLTQQVVSDMYNWFINRRNDLAEPEPFPVHLL